EAGKIRDAETEQTQTGLAMQPAAPTDVRSLVRGSSNPDFLIEPPRPDPLGQSIGLFVGPHIRAALAAILLAGCGLWIHQNGLLSGAEVQPQATNAVEVNDLSGLRQPAARDA